MDSLAAFAMGQANRGKETMVFDWDKAAKLIAENKPKEVRAGLRDDWRGTIYSDGKPVPQENTCVYLESTWAVPEIDMDDEVQECYRMQSQTPGWDSQTYWPESALAILGVASKKHSPRKKKGD